MRVSISPGSFNGTKGYWVHPVGINERDARAMQAFVATKREATELAKRMEASRATSDYDTYSR